MKGGIVQILGGMHIRGESPDARSQAHKGIMITDLSKTFWNIDPGPIGVILDSLFSALKANKPIV